MNGIQNNSEKLKMQLRKIEYPDKITFDILSEQNPIIFLKIIHYILIDYSSDFYKSILQHDYLGLLEKNYELYTKNDLRFIEQVLKLAQKELNYKASINISQFLSEQFLEQKIIFVNDMIDEVLKRHSKKFEYKKQSKSPQDFNQHSKPMNQSKENIDNNYQQNLTQPAKHSRQIQNQEYQFQSEEDDELCQPIQRPQPYQFSNCKVPNVDKEILENQSYCELNTPFIVTNESQNNVQQLNNNNQILKQETKESSLSKKQVTHEDLQKLMQVILMSNENIKQVMLKFTELQTTVNMALSNFNDRLQHVENHLNIHNP